MTRKDFDKIRNGMRSEEVERILGKPTRRRQPPSVVDFFKANGATTADEWFFEPHGVLIYVGYDATGAVVAKAFMSAPGYF